MSKSKRIFKSDDPMEPSIIFELKNGGHVLIDFMDNESKPVYISPKKMLEMEVMLQERLRRYVYTNAILTIVCGTDEYLYSHKWDVRIKGNRAYYGYNFPHYVYLVDRMCWCLERYNYVGLLLRSFLDKWDEEHDIPFKEIRGYYILKQQDEIRIVPIEIKELYEIMNTDPISMKPLKPEPALVYCREDTCQTYEQN